MNLPIRPRLPAAMQKFDRDRIKLDFNRAAHTYDMHALLQRRVADHLFTLLKQAPLANNRILDAGCGTGYFHELARKNSYLWHITQLDIAFAMCQISMSYASPPSYGGTYTINGDIETMPFPDNYFGAVFSSLALQWSNNLNQALAEIYRVLAPGGTALISTLAPGTLHELSESFSQSGFHSPINHFLDEAEVTSQLPATGTAACQRSTLTLHYKSVLQLMRSLKALGARHKHAMSNPYLGKAGIERITTYYRQTFGDSNGLPVTWNIFYLNLRK